MDCNGPVRAWWWSRRIALYLAWLFAAGLPTWWAFDREPPVRLDAIKISEPDVARGGLLKLVYWGFRFRNCDGDIQRIIVDGQEVVHLVQPYSFTAPSKEEQPSPLTALGDFRLNVSAPVPEGAASGAARYQAVVHYKCNPFQRWGLYPPIDVTTPVQHFMIGEDEVDRPERPQRVPGAIDPIPPSDIAPLVPQVPAVRRRSDLGTPIDAPTFVHDAPLSHPSAEDAYVIGQNDTRARRWAR